jgi:Protein of unknown function (DUF2585)
VILSDPLKTRTGLPLAIYIFIGLAVMALAACLEHFMGRLLISKTGQIHLWAAANSSENSQQLADAYSFSHIIHGFFLYYFFRLISRRRWSIGLCLLLTVCLECSWEVLENSPIIIDRYRQTASLGYTGDTILNSMSDISFCILGFALAAWLPWWIVLSLTVIMEIGCAIVIRDNLTLNIIMLIHPFQAIKQWQLGLATLSGVPQKLNNSDV